MPPNLVLRVRLTVLTTHTSEVRASHAGGSVKVLHDRMKSSLDLVLPHMVQGCLGPQKSAGWEPVATELRPLRGSRAEPSSTAKQRNSKSSLHSGAGSTRAGSCDGVSNSPLSWHCSLRQHHQNSPHGAASTQPKFSLRPRYHPGPPRGPTYRRVPRLQIRATEQRDRS